MHVGDTGSGLPIVLLHAFPYDSRMWEHQIHALSSSQRVLAPDFPGFGRSKALAADASIDAWAADLLAQFEAIGVRQAVVVGCSMGGYVAFALLHRAPKFFAGFALVNSRAGVDTDMVRQRRLAMIEKIEREGTRFLIDSILPTFHAHPEAVETVMQMLQDATPAGVIAAQKAMAGRTNSADLLGGIHVPALILHGMLDDIVSEEEARQLAAAIPGATFEPVEGARHVASLDQPDAITAALWKFSERCQRALAHTRANK